MSSLEQLLDGPIANIYTAPQQQSQQHQQKTTPMSSSQSSSLITTAHAAPQPGQRQAAPSQKELVELYNSMAGRWVAEGYEMMDGQVQQETYAGEGTWGLSVTSQSMTASRRVETQATIQLNRQKQDEAPIGWEVNTTFATNSGHFIGNIDQDGVSVRCFAGIGAVGYQGSQTISYGGDEDNMSHSFTYQPSQRLALGYKYQSFPQATVQSFSAATKVDTIGMGLETTFVQGNVMLAGKLVKKWFVFPTPDVRRGDDATAEMQQAQRQMSRSQILTSASVSTSGDVSLGVASKVGWKAIRDFALSTKLSLAQGKLDVRGALSFLILGRRIKLHFDQDASFTVSGRSGVWGDANLDLEGKFEFNPIQLVTAGQLPVISAKLNWNIPVPQDEI